MSYLELNIIFVAVAALVLAGGLWRRAGRATAFIAVLVAIGVLFVLTIVFDNVMIVSGLFDYGESSLSWARIGLMPLEDLAYPLAGAMLLPGLWLLFSRGRKE
ncbi:lycopene cyclase domain-containing protein [Arthrobacter cryoconiti]|uniref:Lycopene cyclase domain-containing protein n=1 Tax=Arthrobacter cryoconiti TaxID=748907 RepID=A0ABV8QXQ3_9MICC|nr:lycopene cyclase domain-containing protein [Arthrobacter cryoconiti]MCC9068696.1 lycopene cyclase domain-containing protein [Arthrobacter cryoconiti]